LQTVRSVSYLKELVYRRDEWRGGGVPVVIHSLMAMADLARVLLGWPLFEAVIAEEGF